MRLAPLFALLLLPLPHRDAPEAVDGWGEAFARGRTVDAEDLEALERALIDLRGYGRLSRPHRERAARSLLDLYGAGLAASRTPARERSAEGWSLAQLARAEFEALADPELVRWAAEEVLVLGATNPPARRAAAAHLLAESPRTSVLRALKVCARAEDDGLRAAAFEALVGRRDEGVHRLFAQTLWGADARLSGHILGAAEAHFRKARLGSDSPVLPVLESYVRERITDTAWRRASRAASVSAGLPDGQAVPLLILGLEAWNARNAASSPKKRVQHDLRRELKARSGMDLGLDPTRWSTWWDASSGGQARPLAAAPPRTTSSFFGLRPTSDRLVFVLDRSGSMGGRFASAEAREEGWTRYDEALEQMVGYLEALGPGARFNLVLFADGARAWRRGLQPVTPNHLRAARAWAQRQPPEGGTRLRQGVELGMAIEEDGSIDLEALEADTLVVLCDGKTDEGQRWVLPVLRRVNPRARVAIHGVRIGDAGDGTLELLAEATGGDFVAVEE